VTRVEFPNGVVLEWWPNLRKCIARFPDGTEAHAIPHETDAYRAHAKEKSTGDIDHYCWQHDLCHQWAALAMGWPYSIVLWNLAHGLPTDTHACEMEEIQAQELQKKFFLRCD
jgi:hypothetical protein